MFATKRIIVLPKVLEQDVSHEEVDRIRSEPRNISLSNPDHGTSFTPQLNNLTTQPLPLFLLPLKISIGESGY